MYQIFSVWDIIVIFLQQNFFVLGLLLVSWMKMYSTEERRLLAEKLHGLKA